MKKLTYNTGKGPSDIYIGLPMQQTGKIINCENTVIITDENINELYGKLFPDCPVIVSPPGEATKRLSFIEIIIERLLHLEIGRSHFLLGIGGGVICDITGFVASVYLRGVKFGFISTSLLSQIDASTGGKNGVNVGGYKNVAGCFTQPRFVVCDPQMLSTLPEKEYLSGLGELVKYALIKDSQLFEQIENNIDLILKRDVMFLTYLIETSVKIKIAVVENDERENGERRLLNFGHTVGHAIELHTGMNHGIAVSQGIQIASKLSVEEGLLTKTEFNKIDKLLKKLGLIQDLVEINDSVIELLKRDKKREKEIIHFVFLNGIGNGEIKSIPIDSLIDRLKKWN